MAGNLGSADPQSMPDDVLSARCGGGAFAGDINLDAGIGPSGQRDPPKFRRGDVTGESARRDKQMTPDSRAEISLGVPQQAQTPTGSLQISGCSSGSRDAKLFGLRQSKGRDWQIFWKLTTSHLSILTPETDVEVHLGAVKPGSVDKHPAYLRPSETKPGIRSRSPGRQRQTLRTWLAIRLAFPRSRRPA